MNSKNDHSPDELRDDLAALKARLEQSEGWPAEAHQLLVDLEQSQLPARRPDEENDDLLSLVVDDALRGVDISTRYPAFCRQMLVDRDLQQAFLETLDALERQSQTAATPLAESQSQLDFLSTPAISPLVEFLSPAHWRLVWHAALDQIQAIFFAAAQFEPIYRSDDYLEDAWFTLFRNEVEVDRTHLNVVLEGVRLMAAPDDLQLHLAVGLTPDQPGTTDRPPGLRAHLTWGDYDQTVIVTERGRATFPPLPLRLILDETAQRVTSDLRLIVEPAL